MELNSFILSAEVENFRMRQKLEKMGTTDILTGVLNRNAMNRRIEEPWPEVSCGHGIGVVFIDLNGLKTANDIEGHNKGDEMLKNVAEKLKSVYRDKEIYRVGGDEFLVIAADTGRDEFDALFRQLETLSSVPGEPAFAVGSYYDDTGMDIAKILHIADKNMYRNKAEYYENNPKIDRRVR